MQIVLPLLIVGSLLFSYQSQLANLIKRWNSGDNNYCLLVIPLFAYLLWEKRASFNFMDFSWNWLGVLIAIFSSLMVLAGELGSVETLTYFGFCLAIVGLICLLYGGRIRWLIFPIVVLFFIVPLPPYINQVLTFQLKMLSSSLSVMMLRLFDVSVLQDGNIIDLGVSKLQVADACSGLRYFMPMLLMSLLIGHLTVRKFWQKCILILLVVPLSVFINGIRIFVAGILSVNGHEEMATNYFHEFSGWFGFMILAGLLVVFASILKKANGRIPETKVVHDTPPPQVNLMRSVILSFLLCLIFTGTSWLVTYGDATCQSPERQNFTTFPMQLGDWQGKRTYLSDDILNSLWADDYVQAYYTDAAQHCSIYLLVPYYSYQGTRHTAHAPQSCLLGGGFNIESSRKRTIKVGEHKEIKIMAINMKKGGQKVLASYFYLQRGRILTNPWLNKFYIMWDSLVRRRTDGSLVRIELQMPDSMSYEEAGAKLDSFIQKLWPNLAPYIPS